MSNENRLTYLGSRIVEKVEEFVERAYSSAAKAVKVEVEVPKGFVRATNQPATNATKVGKSSAQSGVVGKVLPIVLSTVLPAGLAFAGWQINSNFVDSSLVDSNLVAVVLAGVGGLISRMIPLPFHEEVVQADSVPNNAPLLQSLRREDIKFQASVDDTAKAAFLSEIRDEVLKLGLDISDFEAKGKSKNAIDLNQNFGEWAQRFIMYAYASSDKRLQRICDAFVNQLETMGITVYDELVLNSEGKPDVPSPFRDYLFDARQGKDFTKVERPAIYSDRQVLAKGKVS